MSTLLTHCGSRRCSLEELLEIPEPQKTDTYTPLNHYDFASNVLSVASDLLSGFQLDSDQYALSSGGQKMFGVITYKKAHQPDDQPINLSVGIRNSYDRSMSAGLTIGGSVIVCDNLIFSGDIVIMRKHTGDIKGDLHDQIVTNIYRCQHRYSEITKDMEAMQHYPMDRRAGHQYLGILTGELVLSPTQSTKAFRELADPSHEAFTTPTLWSAYNAATEALKSSPPQDIISRHSRLHGLTRQLYLN